MPRVIALHSQQLWLCSNLGPCVIFSTRINRQNDSFILLCAHLDYIVFDVETEVVFRRICIIFVQFVMHVIFYNRNVKCGITNTLQNCKYEMMDVFSSAHLKDLNSDS